MIFLRHVVFVSAERCTNVTIIPNIVLEVNKTFQMQIEAFDPDNASDFFNILSQVSTLTIVDDDCMLTLTVTKSFMCDLIFFNSNWTVLSSINDISCRQSCC